MPACRFDRINFPFSLLDARNTDTNNKTNCKYCLFGIIFFFCSVFILIYRLGPIDALNEPINGWIVLCVAATAAAGCRLQSSLLWYWTSCCRKNMYLIFASNPTWCAPHTNIIWTNCTVCCFNVSESVQILCVCCQYSMMRLHHPWNGRERKREWERAIEREREYATVFEKYIRCQEASSTHPNTHQKRGLRQRISFFYQIFSLISHCFVIALFKFNVRRSISGGMMWWIQLRSSFVPIIIITIFNLVPKIFSNTVRVCVLFLFMNGSLDTDIIIYCLLRCSHAIPV